MQLSAIERLQDEMASYVQLRTWYEERTKEASLELLQMDCIVQHGTAGVVWYNDDALREDVIAAFIFCDHRFA